MALEFEWDPAKAAANARKHRVTFAEAMTAFADPLGSRRRLLAVMFTERGPDRVRLISARPATRPERRTYEEGFC